jgi:hypothetical protein
MRVTTPRFDWLKSPSSDGPRAPAEGVRRARAGEAIVPGVHDLARRQHHLERAHVGEAIAVRPGSIAALERVADHAGVRRGAGGADEEARAS